MELVLETDQRRAPLDPMLPRPWLIDRVRQETHDTFTLELVPGPSVTAAPPGRFLPGQFNMLYVFGVGEVPISISGDPGQAGRLVHTTRAVGAVTRAMRQLKRGGQLGVRGPYGTGWPVEAARGDDLVLVAGGIGLAPLRSVVYQVLAEREKYGRVVILFGARSAADLLFRRELEKWRSRFDLDVLVTVDRASSDWRGSVGVVTKLIGRAPFDPFNATALLCGPEIMMRYTVDELLRRGMPPGQVYLSMERNMKCAIGLCGHCQFGAAFVCQEGPVFPYPAVERLFSVREG
jgi:NAD(P)H-flavin reductase